jgi:hypothetical protein
MSESSENEIPPVFCAEALAASQELYKSTGVYDVNNAVKLRWVFIDGARWAFKHLALTQMPSELDAIRAKVMSWARERQPCDGACDNLGICSQCADVYTIMAGVEQTFKEMGLRPKSDDFSLTQMPESVTDKELKLGLVARMASGEVMTCLGPAERSALKAALERIEELEANVRKLEHRPDITNERLRQIRLRKSKFAKLNWKLQNQLSDALDEIEKLKAIHDKA